MQRYDYPKGALPRMEQVMEPFDGQPVIRTAVKITRAGDGLSEALGADGVPLHLGQEVNVLLGCVVVGADVRPVDKETLDGPLVVKYVLQAGDRATITDDEDAERQLAEQHRRVLAARGIEPMVEPDGSLNPEAEYNGPDAETVDRVLAAVPDDGPELVEGDDGYTDVAPT